MIGNQIKSLNIHMNMNFLFKKSLITIKSLRTKCISTQFVDYSFYYTLRFALPLDKREDMIDIVWNNIPLFSKGINFFFLFGFLLLEIDFILSFFNNNILY